jgi:hypothetical protein
VRNILNPKECEGAAPSSLGLEGPLAEAVVLVDPCATGQAVTSNVAVSSAVELPPTQTSNVEGSSTQSRSAAFQ